MEHSRNVGPVANRMPFRSSASFMRNVEETLTAWVERYLYRRVRKSGRSHFCFFLLFLLSGRHFAG